jgi:hypothetical protein
MNLTELKFIIDEAVFAKEHSDDMTFAEILQNRIEAFVSKVEQVMGIPVDDLLPQDIIPQVLEDAANELNLCHSL